MTDSSARGVDGAHPMPTLRPPTAETGGAETATADFGTLFAAVPGCYLVLAPDALLGEDGGLRYLLHEAEDVTERVEEHASKVAAERREAELRAVLESMPDAVYIGGAEGITLANQAALDQLGFATREALNRGIGTLAVEIRTRDVETGTRIPVEHEAFSRALSGEWVVQDVVVRHGALGEDRVMRCAAAPVVVDGRVVAAVAVNTDVTERRTVEAALRAIDARYRTLFESIDEGFCVLEVLVDEQGAPADYRFLETNPAFVRQGGFDPLAEGTPSRPISEIAPIEPFWIATYGRVAATGEPTRFEYAAAAFGRTYDVFAFRVDAPELRRVAVLVRDVTAQQAAERERERLYAAERAARDRAEAARAEAEAARGAAEQERLLAGHRAAALPILRRAAGFSSTRVSEDVVYLREVLGVFFTRPSSAPASVRRE